MAYGRNIGGNWYWWKMISRPRKGSNSLIAMGETHGFDRTSRLCFGHGHGWRSQSPPAKTRIRKSLTYIRLEEYLINTRVVRICPGDDNSRFRHKTLYQPGLGFWRKRVFRIGLVAAKTEDTMCHFLPLSWSPGQLILPSLRDCWKIGFGNWNWKLRLS